MWLAVESNPTEWVDYNGKPMREHYVKIPYWIVRAYGLQYYGIRRVKIEVFSERFSFNQMKKMETDIMPYFRANWSKKVTKMRKLNRGYMRVKLLHKQ